MVTVAARHGGSLAKIDPSLFMIHFAYATPVIGALTDSRCCKRDNTKYGTRGEEMGG